MIPKNFRTNSEIATIPEFCDAGLFPASFVLFVIIVVAFLPAEPIIGVYVSCSNYRFVFYSAAIMKIDAITIIMIIAVASSCKYNLSCFHMFFILIIIHLFFLFFVYAQNNILRVMMRNLIYFVSLFFLDMSFGSLLI